MKAEEVIGRVRELVSSDKSVFATSSLKYYSHSKEMSVECHLSIIVDDDDDCEIFYGVCFEECYDKFEVKHLQSTKKYLPQKEI